MVKICSPLMLVREFLMNIVRGFFLEEFKPNVIYVADVDINEQELLGPIDWISKNKLHPALLNAKETDEVWEGRFFCAKGEYVEFWPENGFSVKLRMIFPNFQFKFVNTLTDREWKMKLMFQGIEDTVKKMEETKDIFKNWLTLK